MTNKNFSVESFPMGPLEANMTLFINEETKNTVIIDPGNDFEQFMEIKKKLNLNVQQLIHTHGHFDHIGQSPTIQKELDVPLSLHHDDLELYNLMPESAARFGLQTATPAHITTFISDNDELEIFPELSLKVLHTPGHSLGSCCFYTDFFETPLLICGDTLFKRSIGRTDLPGGNHNQLINSIKSKLLTLPKNTKCICGHGPSTTIEEEMQSNPFLK